MWFKRLYRTLFFRGGHGIHSPFVFDLITTVIEELCPFYCYDQLYHIRWRLLQNQRMITINHRNMSVKKALTTYGFTEQEDRLLFRLSNRFRPKRTLALGSDFGLTPLYLTAYATDTSCVVIEPEPSIAAIAAEVLIKNTFGTVDLRNSMEDIPYNIDLLVTGHHFPFAFEEMLSHLHDHSIMVIAGINMSRERRETWKQICSHPKVTVTIDLLRLGIVFFNPKLHQQTYYSIL